MRLALLLLGLLPLLQDPKPVSDVIDPADSRVVYTTHGQGDQIYLCAQQKDGMQWVLKGPAATLTDVSSGQEVGKHGEGPQWTWKDGSAVRGKVVGKRPAPDSQNIPWLLLAASPIPGLSNDENKPGALDHITFVKRSDTQGGIAPTGGCDASHIGEAKSVAYSATYTFYTHQD
jgi:hypothetical protein